MLNHNCRPRYIRYFYNPDRHPDPTPEDLARSNACRVYDSINELSGMARLMLWKMLVRKYVNELCTEIRKQKTCNQQANTRQKQKS